jgi:hypothetical protein
MLRNVHVLAMFRRIREAVNERREDVRRERVQREEGGKP